MELSNLTKKILELFNISTVAELDTAIMKNLSCEKKLEGFCDIVNGDLTVDWMQKIYQYHKADRKEKKQDYTPLSIAKLMCRLVGRANKVVDMCAGTGALTIQYWNDKPDTEFILYEIDKTVIPYLLFNLVVRNIKAIVIVMDILKDEVYEQWEIQKGENFGKCIDIKSAI